MDYAAALRASPAGPAVRLDTTPAAKAPTQKAPVSKPVKVEVEEPVHVAEEETVLSVSVPSAPAKPPTNAGLSPVVRFVITVPSSASASKESHAPAAESNAESSDSSSETEEDASGEVAANGSKSNKNEAKVHNFSAQDLDNVRIGFFIFYFISILYSILILASGKRTIRDCCEPPLSAPIFRLSASKSSINFNSLSKFIAWFIYHLFQTT